MHCYVAARSFDVVAGRVKLHIDIGEVVWLDDDGRLYCKDRDFICPQILGAMKVGWLNRMSMEREASMERPSPRGDVADVYEALLMDGNPY